MAHVAWMSTDLVPFYEKLDHRITALQLESGRRTARVRDALDKIFQMRIEGYRHLIAGLRANQPDAVIQYIENEAKVSQEIEKLQKS